MSPPYKTTLEYRTDWSPPFDQPLALLTYQRKPYDPVLCVALSCDKEGIVDPASLIEGLRNLANLLEVRAR